MNPFTPLFTQTKAEEKHYIDTKMANKLFLVCTTLGLFFLLTNASIYRTVVEFDEDDATNPTGQQGPMQKCRKEFQESQHLRACQKWMRKQMRRPRALEEDDELDFEDDIENQQGPQQRPPVLQQCCSELQQEEPVCVCQTLEQAAKAVRLHGPHGPIKTRRIFRTARRLPNVCDIPQVGVCKFRATPFVPSSY